MIFKAGLVVFVAFLACALWYSDMSPAAQACREKGGRFGFDGCWKVTMTKLTN